MIVVRDVFRCKYGKAGALVELLRDSTSLFPNDTPRRVLTDASGEFDTVISEMLVADLAAWEGFLRAEFANPEFGDWFARMMELVESGRREFFTLEFEH